MVNALLMTVLLQWEFILCVNEEGNEEGNVNGREYLVRNEKADRMGGVQHFGGLTTVRTESGHSLLRGKFVGTFGKIPIIPKQSTKT